MKFTGSLCEEEEAGVAWSRLLLKLWSRSVRFVSAAICFGADSGETAVPEPTTHQTPAPAERFHAKHFKGFRNRELSVFFISVTQDCLPLGAAQYNDMSLLLTTGELNAAAG